MSRFRFLLTWTWCYTIRFLIILSESQFGGYWQILLACRSNFKWPDSEVREIRDAVPHDSRFTHGDPYRRYPLHFSYNGNAHCRQGQFRMSSFIACVCNDNVNESHNVERIANTFFYAMVMHDFGPVFSICFVF